MTAVLKKEILAYSALILSVVPAAFACFGILMISLNTVSSMYSADELLKMALLTVITCGLAFLLIRTAYKHFAKASY